MPVELVQGVHWIENRGAHVYLVESSEGPHLVDAGTPFSADQVRGAAGELGYGLHEIERVLITHFDLDHAGSLSKLDGELACPVHVGTLDADFVNGTKKPPLTNHKGAIQRAMGLLYSPPDLEIRPVEGGDEIGPFEAVSTPGHTPGHTAYVAGEEDGHGSAAFLGDLVKSSAGSLETITGLLSYDGDRVKESIKAMAERGFDFDAACPGHGEPLRTGGSGALEELAERLR